MTAITENHNDPPQDWLEGVRSKVSGIRFGSLQIIVHEGRVTQVELIEKTRIDPASSGPVLRRAAAGKPS